MIATIQINTLDTLKELIFEQEYEKGIGRYRSSLFYRGMPNATYSLVTSLQRNCKNKKDDLEKSILRNFTKYAADDSYQLEKSEWKQLVIGQHHGLPTRLLDWTYSPLVGLHFATSGEDLSQMDQHDAVLWKIDINELNKLLPDSYRNKLSEENAYLFTIDMLGELADGIKKYDNDMSSKSMVLIEPPSIDQRIINQYSYFSIIPKDVADIEGFLNTYTSNTVKYVIAKELKWRIRDMLDQMNMSERMVYPGLDGLSMWIKRHYYVKGE